jgi:hypothetical protein
LDANTEIRDPIKIPENNPPPSIAKVTARVGLEFDSLSGSS